MYSRLHQIERDLEAIDSALRLETRVCSAELEERQRLGLHGDQAIRHYNLWMRRYGLEYLCVEDHEVHDSD